MEDGRWGGVGREVVPQGGRRQDPHIPAMQLQGSTGPGQGARPIWDCDNPMVPWSRGTSLNEGTARYGAEASQKGSDGYRTELNLRCFLYSFDKKDREEILPISDTH